MFWKIRRFFRNIPYRIRSIVFRVRHGFPMEDCWSLDDATARFLAPRLRYLAENNMSYPGENINEELWTAILYKMADGFERMTKPDWDLFSKDTLDYAEECLDLFREFFFNLWD